MSFYSEDELRSLGFRSVGKGVKLSRNATIYGAGRISLGNHVRIDDFCVVSAGEKGIRFGDYVHVAVHCSVMGAGEIVMEDFSGLSSRVSIYSSNDDYSGSALTNPTVPARYTNVTSADVHVGRHAIIGSGAIVLPGVTIEEGAAIGALSLVNRDCKAFGIYSGIPARRIKERSRDLLELEKRLRLESDAEPGNQ